MNHSVTMVGYGYDSSVKLDYWLCKNLWGKSWGEQGHFRIRRGIGLAVSTTTLPLQLFLSKYFKLMVLEKV